MIQIIKGIIFGKQTSKEKMGGNTHSPTLITAVNHDPNSQRELLRRKAQLSHHKID